MLIKQSSSIETAGYGRILPYFPPTDGVRQLSFSMASQIPQYLSRGQIVLDYLSGMSILMIFTSNGVERFYLDRVVALLPGTRFSIMPIDDTCSISILAQEEELSPVGYIPAEELKKKTGGLQFEGIYTFLYQAFSPNFYFRGEQHRPYELVYVNLGHLHNLVGGQDVILGAQHFMIIDSNTWHTQYSDHAIQFLTVSFWASDSNLSRIINNAYAQTPQQMAIFQKMLVQDTRDPYASDHLESLLTLLLLDLLQNPQPDTTPVQSEEYHQENEIVTQAIRIISENVHKKLALEDLSARVHVSVPYLYKLFHTHLGISPGKYIARIRIEECKILLREGQLSMGAVAQKMGFSSLQHFSRQFHSICGMTPTQYVRSLK